MMDLISTFSALDVIAGVSAVMMFGMMRVALISVAIKLWMLGMENPLVQSFVNTTLVVLETTKDVWQPVVNATALVLQPVLSMAVAILAPLGSKALVLLKPFGPYALMAADTIVKGMVLFGYLTTLVVVELVQSLRKLVVWIQGTGMSVQMAMGNALTAIKDLAFSVGTLARALGYLASRVLYAASYVITSFENVSRFLYSLVFEAHTITWEDVSNVAMPFVVVTCILAYLVYRASAMCRKPSAPEKKTDGDCFDSPRRSSRLARKRAMLYCSDLNSAFPSNKASSSASYL